MDAVPLEKAPWGDTFGMFTDVTAECGLAEPRLSLGAAPGDFDNDGWPDLAITCADAPPRVTSWKYRWPPIARLPRTPHST